MGACLGLAASLAAVTLVAMGAAGCRGLLGIQELSDDSDAGDASGDGSDGAAEAEVGSGVDGSAHDAAEDTHVSPSEGGSPDSGSPEAGCAGMMCDGGCVLPGDTHNCGACGNDCTALSHVSATGLQCVGGTCSYSCASGFTDCADAGRGCPDDLSRNGNCGMCGVTCAAPTALCQGSMCSSSCSGTTPDLCGMNCTDKQTDPSNCGMCGNPCMTSVAHAAPSCSGGMCGYTCNTALGYTPCAGACVDEQNDDNNCGGCGMSFACTGGKHCAMGSCVCPSGTHDCGGTCSSNSSTASCGTTSCSMCSGPASGTGMPSCNGTSCGVSCTGATPTYCMTTNTCVNTTNDANNCGTCAMKCTGATPVCSGSSCHPPPTWCTSQSAPSGVAASDFQCVDFDTGLPASSTWVQTQSTGGAFALSGNAFSSSPSSLSMSVPAAPDPSHQGVATLAWTNVGGTNIGTITVSAMINPAGPLVVPAWSGSVQVLCAKANIVNGLACLEYINEGSLTSKLQIHWSVINSGGAAQGFCPLPASWMYNTWNSLQLTYVPGTGNSTVTLNGTTTTCAGRSDSDTSATVTVGLQAFPVTNDGLSAYYDNVLAYVSR